MSAPPAASNAAAASSSSSSSATSAVSESASASAVSSSLPISSSDLEKAIVTGQHHHGSQQQGDKESASNIHLICKWTTKEYPLQLPASATVGFLKMEISLLTSVLPHHQKLILKPKNGAKLTDDLLLSSFELKPNTKFMMIGNVEKDLFQEDAGISDLVDDMDYDYREAKDLKTEPEIAQKLEKYWERIKDTFCIINPIRGGKKLLVLDLDYTLFDMKGKSEDWKVLKRPYTHRFLTAMYEHYELVIWSQTSWRWLELKLTELGILTHPKYKICFVLDKNSMFSIHSSSGSSGEYRKHHVKPLDLIWRKFPAHWSAKNTIHIDDLMRNFALNPQSGLKISAYKNSEQGARQTDKELIFLTEYLKRIAKVEDFSKLDHSTWKKSLEGFTI